MKVETSGRSHEVYASAIRFGECFLYDEELHIRTNGAFSSNDGSFPVRIVNLSTGEENGIALDRFVIPVKVKCVRDCLGRPY